MFLVQRDTRRGSERDKTRICCRLRLLQERYSSQHDTININNEYNKHIHKATSQFDFFAQLISESFREKSDLPSIIHCNIPALMCYFFMKSDKLQQFYSHFCKLTDLMIRMF